MNSIPHLTLICFIQLALLAGCGLSRDLPPLPFTPAGPQSAPDPMEMGPFPVGVKTMTLVRDDRIYGDTGQPRKLVTEVWYPAVQEARDGPFWSYYLWREAPDFLDGKREELRNSGTPGIDTTSVRDAAIEKAHGPYPVILYSHGSNSVRWQSTFYTQHLASHGYIVVSPEHERNTIWEFLAETDRPEEILLSATDRLEDSTFLLDRFTDFNADRSGFFHQTMDLEQVGITGHSFGGFTATAAPCRDPRFKAAVLHSPIISAASLFGCDFSNYSVPILVMSGSDDGLTDWQSVYCDYARFQGVPKYLVELHRAGHFSFTDMCRLDLTRLADSLEFADSADILDDGCSPTDNIHWRDANRNINHYGTAFFNVHLRGSAHSASYLEEKNSPPFDSVTFNQGNVPAWPDGGCD